MLERLSGLSVVSGRCDEGGNSPRVVVEDSWIGAGGQRQGR